MHDSQKLVGAWNIKKALHIICKKLLPVYYSLRSFIIYFQNKHMKIFSNSQIAELMINKMGTSKSSVCDINKNICLLYDGVENRT